MSRLHQERKPAKKKGAVTPNSPLGDRPFPPPPTRGGDANGAQADRVPPVTPFYPTDRYADLGGLDSVLDHLYENVEFPIQHPEAFKAIGVPPPSGIILYGPPGCGKTRLAHALAGECGVPLFSLPATEIVSGISGDSEARLRATFRAAEAAAPSIIFIDQIDAVAGTKSGDAPREMSRRLVAQLGLCLDNLAGAWQAAAAQQAAVHCAPGAGAPSSAPVPPPQSPTSPIAPATSMFPQLPGGGPAGVVMCICATSALESVDSSLRRPGRFEREIAVPIPSRDDRAAILGILTRTLRLAADVDISDIARRTPGYVGADFVGVVKAAAGCAVRRLIRSSRKPVSTRAPDAATASPQGVLASPSAGQKRGRDAAAATASAAVAASAATDDDDTRQRRNRRCETRHPPLTPEQLAAVEVTMADFDDALSKAQPCAMREGFSTVPSVTWDDVGAMEGVRQELIRTIEMPVRYPHLYAKMGVRAAAGVLLYGPPGCGKTLVAKAAANGCGANFISIKGPELLNKFVGESERAVRSLFARARASAPCVLFFDELDALAPRRGTDNNGVSDRVVNQLLTELDGVEGRDGVFVVGATNRRDMIDDALLRPGRYDKVLAVDYPSTEERERILSTLLRKVPNAGIDAAAVAAHPLLMRASGADLAHIVKEAALASIEREMARATALVGDSDATGIPLLSPSAVAAAASRLDVDAVVVTMADVGTALEAFGRQRRVKMMTRAPPAAPPIAAVVSSPGASGAAAATSPAEEVDAKPPAKRRPDAPRK